MTRKEMELKKISKERITGVMVFVLAIYAMVSIVVNVMLFEIRSGSPHVTIRPLSAGTTAPAFELESLEGDTVSLAQFEERPVLLMFWGTS
jgi:cytochrome oxidase Cu insertion factor (SCO1/SenC/PrrC family)